MHLPNIRSLDKEFTIQGIISRSPHNSTGLMTQYGAKFCTTNLDEIVTDPLSDAVLIGTRHDSHAAITLNALSAGKHVFVEKPLSVRKGVEKIRPFLKRIRENLPMLMVGYNRRFSSFRQEDKKHDC